MFARPIRIAAAAAMACAFAFAAIRGASPAAADTVILEPDQDNTIFTDGENNPADLSNGAGPHIFAGQTLFFGVRRGLIEFDVAGNVPPGAVIDDVQLTLHMSLGTSSVSDFGLHRVGSDWGEGTSDSGTGPMGSGAAGGQGAPATPGDATWLHTFYDTQFWMSPGGDFAAIPSATTIVSGIVGDYVWTSTPALVSDVQGWLDNPGSNFGWLILGPEPGAFNGTAKRFDSRENTMPEFRPRLRIDYTMPPTEVFLNASRDNTIFTDGENNPADLANGVGPHIFAGQTLFFGVRRGLIAFDIAGAIPPGVFIIEAELTLHMSLGTSSVSDFGLHRVGSDWGEGTSDSGTGPMGSGSAGGQGAPATPGDATWLHTFYDTQFWMSPGGDFTAIPSATTTVSGFVGDYTWASSPALVADVQNWLDNPGSNFGWLILGPEPGAFNGTAKRFDSRENTTPEFRPRLRVVYSTTPPGCGTCDGDVDGDETVNGADAQGFLDCLMGGDPTAPGCACANMNGDDMLSIADVGGFVAAALQTVDCPP